MEPVQISLLSYKNDENEMPLKKGCWICNDVDEDLYEGRALDSVKDVPEEMKPSEIQKNIMFYNKYVYNGARRLEGKEVLVETFMLE